MIFFFRRALQGLHRWCPPMVIVEIQQAGHGAAISVDRGMASSSSIVRNATCKWRDCCVFFGQMSRNVAEAVGCVLANYCNRRNVAIVTTFEIILQSSQCCNLATVTMLQSSQLWRSCNRHKFWNHLAIVAMLLCCNFASFIVLLSEDARRGANERNWQMCGMYVSVWIVGGMHVCVWFCL